MKPFAQFTREQAGAIRYLLCDIDDTITHAGKLPAESYAALWKLQQAGIKVIPVTGRPAGWCDLIVRQWPVEAVVGENGAFVFYMRDGHRHTFTHPGTVSDPAARLQAVREEVLRRVPGSRVAGDQFARIYDLAIDFNEDPPYLGLEAAEQIRSICVSMGAEAKISSIHVNTWFGKYDKLSMTQLFFKEVLGEEALRDHAIFFGDSPNDEPMFSFFGENSCGVGNVRAFADRMTYLPGYVTERESAAGFAEAVDHILKMR